MLDNFREWLSDNLRYILLGLAILAVLLILFFGGRAIFRALNSGPAQEEQQTEQEEKYFGLIQDLKRKKRIPMLLKRMHILK